MGISKDVLIRILNEKLNHPLLKLEKGFEKSFNDLKDSNLRVTEVRSNFII